MNEEVDVSEEVLQEAEQMGWVPQEKFKGNPDKWVSAEEFVERGKNLLPILNQNNKRLQRDLLTRDQKIGTLEQQLKTVQETLDTLSEHYNQATARAVEEGRKQLVTQLREARENGDEEAEQQILGKLDDIREAQRSAKKEEEDKKNKKNELPPRAYTEDLEQDTKDFLADNPWYEEDKKRAKAFTRLAEDMREGGDKRTGREFLDAVLEALEEQEGEQGEPAERRRPSSKVESSNNRSSTRGSSKSFASLPADAKDACHADNDKLVGEGKMFKTVKEWEDYYAREFYKL